MKFELPQLYFSKIMRAIVEFDLIQENDHILIGLSGGKDSLLLTYALAMMRERLKKPFTLGALTINPKFSEEFDMSRFVDFCKDLEIPYEITEVDINGIIENHPKKSPCFSCAFFRRGAINRYAVEHGFNKIAYAHHHDDAVETLLMGLFYSGHIQTFTPKTYLDRTDLTVIRPLIYLRESETRAAVKYHGIAPLPSPCPHDGKTVRQTVKEMISSLSKDNPMLYDHLAAAMRKNNVGELWPASKTRKEMAEVYKSYMYPTK